MGNIHANRPERLPVAIQIRAIDADETIVLRSSDRRHENHGAHRKDHSCRDLHHD
jgi:hypothetical protein